MKQAIVDLITIYKDMLTSGKYKAHRAILADVVEDLEVLLKRFA